MAKIFNLKAYLHAFLRKKIRIVILIAFILFFITIPSRIIYDIPVLEKKPPIFRNIDISIPSPDPYPVNITRKPAPYLTAESVIVVDVNSKAVIYLKKPDKELSPASTTKMVTALVSAKEFPMDKVFTIEKPRYEGQVMKLVEGENITLKNLLYGLLVYSGNDAAESLADSYPGGRNNFIKQMNKEVKNLGLNDTNFSNPTGLDEGNHYSTVHDLAIIGAEVMSNPTLAEIVSTKEITVTDTSGEIEHKLENINKLLGFVPGLKGIKTGWTEIAGECLVAYTERDGHAIITAVLGSSDRFGETRSLVEWVYVNHEWK